MTIGLIMVAILAAGSPFRPLPDEQADGRRGAKAPVAAKVDQAMDEGRANLPYAFGQRFHTLDEYLTHLERRAGPIDLPWWRRIGPDRFEHVRGKAARPGERPVATRAELMRRFGFRR